MTCLDEFTNRIQNKAGQATALSHTLYLSSCLDFWFSGARCRFRQVIIRRPHDPIWHMEWLTHISGLHNIVSPKVFPINGKTEIFTDFLEKNLSVVQN